MARSRRRGPASQSWARQHFVGTRSPQTPPTRDEADFSPSRPPADKKMVRKLVVAALCAVARAASNDAGAPVPFAEFAAPADKADGAAEGRMQQMFQDVRRLQYSYDFASTCVSSLMACVSDADCADDEECSFPRRTRKTRRLSEEDANAGRALKFGANAVGQCVCK